MLQQALAKLLETKGFDQISVQDVAEQATVNRATFYDHYNDKFALLQCLVGSRFHELLAEREVHFDGSCGGVLEAIALTVCEYLTQMQGPDRSRPLEPHMESAVIAVLRQILLGGLEKHPPQNGVAAEIVAATASWAIYGAAREWVRTPNHAPSEEIALTVQRLVAPILHFHPA